MADVVVFHHVQGLTEGMLAFADGLRSGGHRSDRSGANCSPTRATAICSPTAFLPSYDPHATALVLRRSAEFLNDLG